MLYARAVVFFEGLLLNVTDQYERFLSIFLIPLVCCFCANLAVPRWSVQVVTLRFFAFFPSGAISPALGGETLLEIEYHHLSQ